MPTLTRRRLLATGAPATVLATLPSLVTARDAIGRPTWLRRASYAGRVGETFRVVLADGRIVSLRLAGVENLVGTSPSGRSLKGSDAAFLLELQGPAKPSLEQGVRELRHPVLGRGMLFLVPEAPHRRGSRYAVVVNRHGR